MSIQVQEAITAAVQYINPLVDDGLQKRMPLSNILMKNRQHYIDGGLFLQFTLKLLANQSQAFVPLTGINFDVSPSVQLQRGTLNWAASYFNMNITLSDYIYTADTDQAKINMIKEKTKGATADFIRKQSTAFWGSRDDDANSYNGIKDICANGDYAGLDPDDYTDGIAPYLPYISTDTEISYDTISKMIIATRARSQMEIGGSEIVGLMNDYVFSKMMSVLATNQVFVNTDKLFLGSSSFNINGVEFFMDVDCPGSKTSGTADNWIVTFPKEIIEFNYKYGLDKESPIDTGAKGMLIPTNDLTTIRKVWTGNVVCRNRRLFSVCKTIQ